MSGIGWGLCIAGMLIILIAASGIIRLPDVLSRQHAATKAATVAVMLFVMGTMIVSNDAAWTWRLMVILLFLFLTLPLASHVLAQAAYREMNKTENKDN